MKRPLIKPHHKIGLGIVALGVLVLASSLAFPPVGSYLFIIGLVVVFIGVFVIDPMALP